MNPIVRMMKRYIKMPLKYALPLLFICALVLSATTGCTDSASPTATPTVKATATATVIATASPKATATPTVKATQTPTPKPTPTPTPKPAASTPTPTSSPPCNCYGPDLDCGDFASKSQARSCYSYCKSLGLGDVFRLDGDSDGIACE